MRYSIAAAWLDTVFYRFDAACLSALHSLALAAKGVLTPFFIAIGYLSDDGLLFMATSAVLLLFRRTRKTGFALGGSVLAAEAIAWVLKRVIERPRPFSDPGSAFHGWRAFLGLGAESGFSFPSGHVAAATAAALALFFAGDKRFGWICFPFVVLTGLARCYLMVHYPTDVIGGLAVGSLGALAALSLAPLARRFLEGRHTALRKGRKA